MDLKKDKEYMFTCKACKHWRATGVAETSGWSGCRHPSIDEIGLVMKAVEDVTKEDWMKLEHLVKDILHLRVTYLGFKIPHFEFPFRYETTWITGCDGFEKGTSLSFLG